MPVAIVLIVGFFKPTFALKKRKKIESWLHQKKKTHKEKRYDMAWWKRMFYPLYVLYLWLSRMSSKFIKSEHWATGAYYGISLFVTGIILVFLFAIISAAVLGTLIILGTILAFVVGFAILKELLGFEGGSSSSFSSGFKSVSKSPFFGKGGKQAYLREDMGGNEYIEDDQGNRIYKRNDFGGNENLVENDGTRWRKGKDLSVTEFVTDDKGNKWHKTKDLSGDERWKNYDSGESARVTKGVHGDKKFIKE